MRFYSLVFVVASVTCMAPAGAAPATPHPVPKRAPHNVLLGRATIRRPSASVSAAAACNRVPDATSGPAGQLGPNGPSRSQTIVAVPLNGERISSATQRNATAEACAHVRH